MEEPHTYRTQFDLRDPRDVEILRRTHGDRVVDRWLAESKQQAATTQHFTDLYKL